MGGCRVVLVDGVVGLDRNVGLWYVLGRKGISFGHVCLSVCGNYRDGALILLEDFLCLDLAGWTGRTHLVLFHVDDLLALFHISIGIVAIISPLCLTVSRPQLGTSSIGNFDTRHVYYHINWEQVCQIIVSLAMTNRSRRASQSRRPSSVSRASYDRRNRRLDQNRGALPNPIRCPTDPARPFPYSSRSPATTPSKASSSSKS